MKPNYEVRVGLFTLFALFILVWGWGWLKSFNLFHPPQKFAVRFQDVAGLNNNAPVNINGVRVGTVDKIDLVSKGQVLAHCRITSDNVVVTKGSTATIQTLGLVGAKYLEIALPEPIAGEPAPPALTETDVLIGEDPVRVELVVNDIATKVAHVFRSVKGDKAGPSLAEALEHSGEAVKNITEASDKLNKNMDSLAKTFESVQSASVKLGQVADKAKSVENSANDFFADGSKTFSGVSDLAQDLRGTTGKFNKLLDNPNSSKDIKDTIDAARQTAETIAKTMREVKATLSDDGLRKDILSMLGKVDASTENIHKSLLTIKSISTDGALRKDLREMIADAHDSLVKLDTIVGDPSFKADLKQTMTKVRTAADNVNLASRQLSQMLSKRAPLLKMMFGRPGNLKEESPDKNTEEKTVESKNNNLGISH